MAGLFLLCLAGCSEELVDVPISVALTPGAGSCAGAQATRSIRAVEASSVRLTVYKPPATGAAVGTLVCDQVLSAGDGSAALRLVGAGDTPLSLLVEVFDGSQPVRLRAAGGLAGFNLKPRLRELSVLVSETGRFSCAPGAMATSRAFHTATPLPNGEVLIIGGLTAEPPSGATGGDKLWATDLVEVYDPRTGLFNKAAAGLSAGRAMHEVVLLTRSGQGPYDLLLVGGVSSAPGSTAPVAAMGGPMPVFPTTGTSTAPTVLLRYYPWTSPPQVQEMSGSPQLKYRVLPTLATTSSGETAIIGGAQGQGSGTVYTVDDFELLPTAGSTTHSGTYPLIRGRVGAVAAPLSTTQLLLFGGNVKSAATSLVQEAAETLTLGSAPKAALTSVEAAALALVSPVAHATLSPYGKGQLLLAGGLTVEAGKATTVKAAKTLLRLSLVASKLRVSEITAGSFAGVAYHRATPLPGGDLLITGGMPSTCSAGAPCGSSAAYNFHTATEGLRTEPAMAWPRMGHRATRMSDGAVLISGGLHHDGSRLLTHKSAELYGPARIDPFNRKAGEMTRRCQ